MEDELLKTPLGRRIKELEKLGIGITLEDTLDKYQERNGYTLDHVGNVKIEKDSVEEIYKENISKASKKIGFDISGLDNKQISQVLDQLEYVQDTKDIKIDGKSYIDIESRTNQKENSLFEICQMLNIQESEYSLDKDDMKKLLSSLNFSDNQINAYIQEYEKASIDSFLENIQDVNLVLALMSYQLDVKNIGPNNLEYEEEYVKEFIKNNCADSKFFKFIVDEDGKIDFEKCNKFLKKFKEDKEKSDLTRKINKYSTKEELNEEDEKKLVEILVVASDIGNDVQKRNLTKIAKSMKLDVLDSKGKLDINKIKEYGIKVYGKDFNFEEILEKNKFEGINAIFELNDIEKSISNGDTIESPTSLEEINKVKSDARKNERRICSAKEKVVYDVLNSQNALTPLVNFYKKEDNAKQLILLFCKFRDEEIDANIANATKKDKTDNNDKKVSRERQFNINSINRGRSDSISGIIKKYMWEHKEEFGEYFKTNGDLDPKKVMEIVETHELSANGSANNLVAYEQIKSRSQDIDMIMAAGENKKKLTKIDNYLKKSKKDELSDEEISKLYTIVKGTPVDIISTENLEALKQLDEERFNETFKSMNVVKNVGKNSIGAIYFSAAKLVVKGMYALPKMLIDKKAREEYMPKIKKHIISGGKKIVDLAQGNEKKDNNTKEGNTKKNSIFNIFKRNKQKRLEAGTPVNSANLEATSHMPIDKVSANQQTFDEYCKVDNQNGQVEKKAAEEVSKNMETSRTKGNDGIEQTIEEQ